MMHTYWGIAVFCFSCHVSSATDLGTKDGRTKDGAGEWVGMGWGTPRARWGAALVSGYVPPEHECGAKPRGLRVRTLDPETSREPSWSRKSPYL